MSVPKPIAPGTKFGLWTVVSISENKLWGGLAYNCRCDCGTEKLVSGAALRSGNSASCGCVGIAGLVKRSLTHGLYNHPLRKVHEMMKARCYNKKHVYFRHYGGRGIKVCERWHSLTNFVEDMAPGYKKGLTMERRDNDGDYSPDNCYWLPAAKQARNRRNTVQLTLEGRTQPLIDWATELNVSVHALRNRYYAGQSHEEILRTPVKSPSRR